MLQSDRLLVFILDPVKIGSFTKGFVLVRSDLCFIHTPHQTCTRTLTPQFVQSTSLMATTPSTPLKELWFFIFTAFISFLLSCLCGFVLQKNSILKPFYFTRTLCHREASSILPKVFPKDSRSRVGTRITEREKQSFSRPHIFFSPFPNRNHVAEGK